MKNWLTQVAMAVLTVFALASCEKDEEKVTITPSNSLALTASTSTVVLEQANSSQDAVTFTWTPINSFTMSGTDKSKVPAVKYQLQVTKQGGSFGYPALIDAGTGSSKAVSVSDLNSALIGLGIAPGTPTPVSVRVAAIVGTDAQTFVSAPVSLTATSYKVCLPPNNDVWSIIGPAGVDWNTDVPLTYNCDTKTYDLTRELKADEFKFRLNSAWTTNYGSSSSTGGALVPDGSNIKVATAGMYTIKLDLANKTYSITK